MRFSNFLIIATIVLFPGAKGCHHPNKTSVIEFDCTKSSLFQELPGTPGIKMFSSSCHDYLFDKLSLKKALEIFVKNYSIEFQTSELDTWKLLKNLKIEVGILPKTVRAAYDVNGKLLEGNVPVSGLALSQDHIWVEIKTNQIWSSSLVHELIHVIIWRNNVVHADPDHEGKNFSGWTKKHTQLIKKINQILLDAEI